MTTTYRLTTIARRAVFSALLTLGPVFAQAQEASEDEFKPQLPDMSIYQSMLEVNKSSGWVQFGNYEDRQLIFFTALQTMHCRLSEIRYSINSEALDKRFPLGACNVEQPFNLPADDHDNKYLMLEFKSNEVKTITVQVVWDDGSGSEIVTYRPCDTTESTCARIKKIDRPKVMTAPQGSSQSR